MKFLFIVFALFIVCVIAHPSSLSFPDIDVEALLEEFPEVKRTINAGANDVRGNCDYIPSFFYCNASVSAKITQNITTIDSVGNAESKIEHVNTHVYYYGLMSLSVIEFFEPTPKKMTTLTRFDLTETRNGVVYVTQFVHDGSSCFKNMITQDEAEAEAMAQRSVFVNKQSFIDKTTSTFNGVDCDMYYIETDDFSMRFYVNDVLLGCFYSFKNASMIKSITFEYTYGDTVLDDMALDDTAYPGCDSAAYTAPTDFECIGAVYKIDEIPCGSSFTRIGAEARIEAGELVPVTVTYHVMYDGLMSLSVKRSNSTSDSNVTIIRRGDLLDGNGIPVYTITNEDDTCDKTYLSPSRLAAAINEDFSFYTKPKRFQYVKYLPISFFGDIQYYMETEELGEFLMVDSKTGMPGLYYRIDKKTKESEYYICAYSDNPDLSLLAVNSSVTPNCDSESFVSPTSLLPCGPFSFSSESTSSDSKASSSTGSKASTSTSTGSKASASIGSESKTSTGSDSKTSTSTGSDSKASTSTGSKASASTGSGSKASSSIGSESKTSTGSDSKTSTSTGSDSKTSTSTGSDSKASTSTGSESKTPTGSGSKSPASTVSGIDISFASTKTVSGIVAFASIIAFLFF